MLRFAEGEEAAEAYLGRASTDQDSGRLRGLSPGGVVLECEQVVKTGEESGWE